MTSVSDKEDDDTHGEYHDTVLGFGDAAQHIDDDGRYQSADTLYETEFALTAHKPQDKDGRSGDQETLNELQCGQANHLLPQPVEFKIKEFLLCRIGEFPAREGNAGKDADAERHESDYLIRLVDVHRTSEETRSGGFGEETAHSERNENGAYREEERFEAVEVVTVVSVVELSASR